MKKKIKKVIWLVIGIIIGSSVVVKASTIFNSKDITYNSDKTTKTNVKESLDELYSKVGQCPNGKLCADALVKNVQLGDYISMTPTSKSATISKDLTGYSVDQPINPSELNLWRVIRKNSDGTVELVSEYVSSAQIYFSGKKGYINFVKGLNEIAAQYKDGKHVIKTRNIGYSNQTEVITDTSFISQTSRPWSVSTSQAGIGECNLNTYLCGRDEDKGAGDIGYETDYNLINTIYGTITGRMPNKKIANYWISSRHYAYSTSGGWLFNVRFIGTNSALNNIYLYYYESKFAEDSAYCSIRPIITIKSTSEIVSGNGTLSSPYKLSD